MNYTIFTREQVIPKRNGNGTINMGSVPVYPAGAGAFYTPPTLDIWSDDPAQRKVLLTDPNGSANYTDIKAAFPGLVVRQLELVKAEAAVAIEHKWPTWAQNNCALGVYGETTRSQCIADIASVITACNTAEDAINAAGSMGELLAVKAVWPIL